MQAASLRLWTGAILTVLALAGHGAVQAQALPTARPEQVGMSSQRLSRTGEWLRGEVAQKKIPGAVIMVVRGGKVAQPAAPGTTATRRTCWAA